jgi:ubiquinone/menaquinone biosynthesis C-methylase UbiE
MATPWNAPEVVARFAVSPPNEVLMKFAASQHPPGKLLDIGCGAGCNAVPLAQAGWDVTGLDLSEPMLEAGNRRAIEGNLSDRLRFEKAPMDQLPVVGNTYDFIVAHGIWNLACSGQ